jgi:UV DNA damage endonuclease
MRLGFAVSVLGRPRLKSHDGRRWPHAPHLSVSLLYLRDIFEYLHDEDIHLYRMSPYLAPYISHPDLPQFQGQIDECAGELELLGRLAADYRIRLSFHATPYIALGAPQPAAAEKSLSDLTNWARLLDRLGAGPEGVIVLHLGGAYGDKAASMERFVACCAALPAEVRRRLAVENDDSTYSVADALAVAGQAGLPVVFDYLHFLNFNPEGLALAEALSAVWRTWPAGVRPKLHVSSPRTELRPPARAGAPPALSVPQWTEHADFVNPFEFLTLARALPAGAEADIMLEAKAKDLAVLRLRADMRRYAPELAARLE